MNQTQAARRGPKPNPHTRANLLHAGVEMMYETGFNAAGIKDIVTRANVPKGSFYNHFASKEAFGAEVVDTYFRDGLPELSAMLTDPDMAPLDRLRHYFEERGRRLVDDGYQRGCLLGNLSTEVADHSDLIRKRIAANFTVWAGLLEGCISQAQQEGTVTSALGAHTLAQFVLNSWEGALLRARAEKSEGPLAEFMHVVFDDLLNPAA